MHAQISMEKTLNRLQSSADDEGKDRKVQHKAKFFVLIIAATQTQMKHHTIHCLAY